MRPRPRRKTAVVHVERACNLCRAGFFVLLRRDGGAWRVVSIRDTWNA